MPLSRPRDLPTI